MFVFKKIRIFVIVFYTNSFNMCLHSLVKYSAHSELLQIIEIKLLHFLFRFIVIPTFIYRTFSKLSRQNSYCDSKSLL